MNVIGIVSEYNPFHNGHVYQINKVKEMYPDSIIVVAMSGNYTERGEFSVIDKWDKTSVVLSHGVDVVLEIPFPYSNQSADTFSYAAIKMLSEFHIDTLVFGSESDDLETLVNTASVQINNPSFDNLVKKYMKQKNNYPTSLSKAIYDLTNNKVTSSNDLLAVSYIKEIIKNKYNIKLEPIKRSNSFKTLTGSGNIMSAYGIRELLKEKKDISKYVPNDTLNYIRYIDYDNVFKFLKYKIISSKDFLSSYHLITEGIDNRIYEAALKSNSMDEFISNIKNKRVTENRIKRMLMNILVGFSKREASSFKSLEYIRVLGMSKAGRNYYKSIKNSTSLPIVTKLERGVTSSISYKSSYIYYFVNDFDNVDEKNKHVILK